MTALEFHLLSYSVSFEDFQGTSYDPEQTQERDESAQRYRCVL